LTPNSCRSRLERATATYGYDHAGRRTTATINGQSWQYAYNGLGQRVRKSGPTGTTLYAYDEAGHLTGEYDGSGQLIQETVWLGDEPVATLRHPAGTTSGPATPYHVHADHLGTPRRITRPCDNKVMWQWESEPFGNTLPEQNPQGQGSFDYIQWSNGPLASSPGWSPSEANGCRCVKQKWQAAGFKQWTPPPQYQNSGKLPPALQILLRLFR
jgi:hypothetical protein